MNRGRRRLSARTGAILRQIEQRAVKRRVQPNRHLPRNVAAPRRKGDFDGLIVPRRAAFRRRVFDAPRLHRRDALNPILKCPGGCRQFERERRSRVRDLRQIKRIRRLCHALIFHADRLLLLRDHLRIAPRRER